MVRKRGVVGGIKRSRSSGRDEWRGERKKVGLELLVCICGRGLFIRWRARAAERRWGKKCEMGARLSQV